MISVVRFLEKLITIYQTTWSQVPIKISLNLSGETEDNELSRDVRFGGHVARIKCLTVANLWKLRRQRKRREMAVHREMRCEEKRWITLAQDRVQWGPLLTEVLNLQVPIPEISLFNSLLKHQSA
jgi:hypothetical protein